MPKKGQFNRESFLFPVYTLGYFASSEMKVISVFIIFGIQTVTGKVTGTETNILGRAGILDDAISEVNFRYSWKHWLFFTNFGYNLIEIY